MDLNKITTQAAEVNPEYKELPGMLDDNIQNENKSSESNHVKARLESVNEAKQAKANKISNVSNMAQSNIKHVTFDELYNQGSISQTFSVNDCKNDALSVGIESDNNSNINIYYHKNGKIYKNNDLLIQDGTAFNNGDRIEVNLDFNHNKCRFLLNDIMQAEIHLQRNIHYSFGYTYRDNSKDDPIDVDEFEIECDTYNPIKQRTQTIPINGTGIHGATLETFGNNTGNNKVNH
mmetsp:Transcript_86666/g.106336  ORF Transcript_86666/g.106336 Transcript_86666/m.106336 type:complete len:234 (-) Transcript_86666:353-1054(-)